MDRKNFGQKVVLERFFDSFRLTIQRMKWSILFGLVSYVVSFNFFVNIRYIYVPIAFNFYKFLNSRDDQVIRKIVSKKTIESKFYIYNQMQDLILKYEIYSLIISVFILSITFFILTKFFKHKGNLLNEGRHYRGLQLVNKKQLDKEIKNEISSKETGLKYTKSDIYIGKENIRIPRELGSGMWAYLGVSGSGKSQAIFSQLLQIRSFGDKAILVDPAGEYCKRFCTENDIILSLYDVRSEYYSFWDEGLDPMTIATSLIEELNTSGNPFWSKAGQALFAGLLALNDSPQAMYEMLLQDSELLKKEFKSQGEAAGVVLGEGEQAGGVMSTAAVDLMWLKNMNFWAKKQGKNKPFSIMKWAKNDKDKRWIFLTYSDRHKNVAKHLVRLWSDLAVLGAFTRGEDKENTPIWLVCDELSTIGKLPSMSLLEDRGRKYLMGIIAGFQTPSQLEVIFGPALARVIIQGLQNILMFRANEREMLEFMSQNCGDAEFIQTTSSTTFGGKKSESISDQIVKKRNVLPDEFRALKNMNAYLKVSGHNPTKVKIQYLELPKINDPDMSFVPKYENWDGKINGKNVLVEEVENTPTIVQESQSENNIKSADIAEEESVLKDKNIVESVQNINIEVSSQEHENSVETEKENEDKTSNINQSNEKMSSEENKKEFKDNKDEEHKAEVVDEGFSMFNMAFPSLEEENSSQNKDSSIQLSPEEKRKLEELSIKNKAIDSQKFDSNNVQF